VQALLKLLADPTRVRILASLEREELAVNEIAEVLKMSQSRISNHLRLLKDGEALQARREGAWTFYRNGIEKHPVWQAVRESMSGDATLKSDEARRRTVLEKRRRRSREHFAAWNGNGVQLEKGTLREELLAAVLPEEWVVVDAGCGDGFLTELLGERFDEVLAFDHAPERLAAARKRLRKTGVKLQKGEVDDFPVESGSADAVFFSMVLHHVPEIAAALAEARRVLRPNGRLVIADLAPHGEEAMREKMGDLRLGLDPDGVVQGMRDAGFLEVRVLPVRDRLVVGRNKSLELILVTGRRPGGKRRTKK
jgi:ArsR family transcriptional regulator